jgi:hypothetical protein
VVSLLQDVVRRYKEAHPGNWDLLPERVAFQVQGDGSAVDGHCQPARSAIIFAKGLQCACQQSQGFSLGLVLCAGLHHIAK